MHASALARMKVTERTGIYLTRLLRGLAFALIGVFIPAYLLTIGFTLQQVLLYLVVNYAMLSVFAPIAAEIAHRWGLKNTVLASPFVSIAYVLGLHFLEYYPELMFPMAIIGAFASVLFWIPIHAHFAKNTGHKHVAEDTGHLLAISELARVVGPITGGLVITYFSFGLLYTISGILLLLCAAPLFMSRDYLVPLKQNWTATLTKENIMYTIVFAAKGSLSLGAELIFPFYVYMQTTSFETTGFVTAAMGIGVMASAIVAGKLCDKIGRHKVMRISAIIACLVWVAVIFVKGDLALYVLSVLVGLSSVLITITVFGIFCNKIRDKKKELAEHMVYREIGLNFGRVPVFLVMLAFPGFMFEIAFALAALSSLYFAFTRRF